jgi:hypothetical protein
MDKNGSGVIYPTVELGGVMYTLRLTQGIARFRLSDAGLGALEFAGARQFASLCKALHILLDGQFPGSVDQLSELVHNENKLVQVDQAIGLAIKKASGPQNPATGEASKPLTQ